MYAYKIEKIHAIFTFIEGSDLLYSIYLPPPMIQETEGRVIPKTQKIVLDASLLNTQHYKVWIKGKWTNPGKGVETSPTPRGNGFSKVSLWVALNNGWPTYL